MPKTDTSDVT